LAVKLERPVTVAVFVVLSVLFVFLLAPRMFQVQKLNERSAELEKELRDLKKQNDTLEQELRMLRDDPVYLEKVARQQFNKAKEGEIVYKVVREGQNTKTS
jgi:cell division protein FtsB